jgi:Flp pilus assembly pilin Flp
MTQVAVFRGAPRGALTKHPIRSTASHQTDHRPPSTVRWAQRGSEVDAQTSTTTDGTRRHRSPIRRRRRSERGAGLTEYALLMALIAAVCLVALSEFGDINGSKLDRNAEKIVLAGQP